MSADFNNPTNRAAQEARLTALLLGELSGAEASALRAAIEDDAELARLYAQLKLTIKLVRETAATPSPETAAQPEPLRMSEARRQKMLAQFKTLKPKEFEPAKKRKRFRLTLVELAAMVAILAILAGLMLPTLSKAKFQAKNVAVMNKLRQLDRAKQQWVQENKVSPDAVPTAEDLKPYLGRGDSEVLAKSIAGEKYSIGKVGEAPSAQLADGRVFGAREDGSYGELGPSKGADLKLPDLKLNLASKAGTKVALNDSVERRGNWVTNAMVINPNPLAANGDNVSPAKPAITQLAAGPSHLAIVLPSASATAAAYTFSRSLNQLDPQNSGGMEAGQAGSPAANTDGSLFRNQNIASYSSTPPPGNWQLDMWNESLPAKKESEQMGRAGGGAGVPYVSVNGVVDDFSYKTEPAGAAPRLPAKDAAAFYSFDGSTQPPIVHPEGTDLKGLQAAEFAIKQGNLQLPAATPPAQKGTLDVGVNGVLELPQDPARFVNRGIMTFDDGEEQKANKSASETERSRVLAQSVELLQKRVDRFGVAEPAMTPPSEPAQNRFYSALTREDVEGLKTRELSEGRAGRSLESERIVTRQQLVEAGPDSNSDGVPLNWGFQPPAQPPLAAPSTPSAKETVNLGGKPVVVIRDANGTLRDNNGRQLEVSGTYFGGVSGQGSSQFRYADEPQHVMIDGKPVPVAAMPAPLGAPAPENSRAGKQVTGNYFTGIGGINSANSSVMHVPAATPPPALVELSKDPAESKGIDWSGTLAKQQVVFGNGSGSFDKSTVDRRKSVASEDTPAAVAAAPSPQPAGGGIVVFENSLRASAGPSGAPTANYNFEGITTSPNRGMLGTVATPAPDPTTGVNVDPDGHRVVVLADAESVGQVNRKLDRSKAETPWLQSELSDTAKVPLLGDMPLAGRAYRSENKNLGQISAGSIPEGVNAQASDYKKNAGKSDGFNLDSIVVEYEKPMGESEAVGLQTGKETQARSKAKVAVYDLASADPSAAQKALKELYPASGTASARQAEMQASDLQAIATQKTQQAPSGGFSGTQSGVNSPIVNQAVTSTPGYKTEAGKDVETMGRKPETALGLDLAPDATAPLEIRTFRVDPNTFRQGLESVTSLPFGDNLKEQGGSSGGSSVTTVPRVSGGTGGGGGPLGGQAGGMGGGLRFVTGTPQAEDVINPMIRSFFTVSGIDFNTNTQPGKTFVYNNRTGTLTVRGTAQDLDMIGAAVETLNIVPPQVNIKAKFDVTDTDPLSTSLGMTLEPMNVQHYNSIKVENETLLAKKGAMLEKLKTLSPEELRQTLPTTVPDPILTSLLQDQITAQTNLAKLQNDYPPDHPEVKRARELQANLDNQMNQRVAGIMQALETEVKTSKAIIANVAEKVEEARKYEAARAEAERQKKEAEAAEAARVAKAALNPPKPAASPLIPQPEVAAAENAFSTFSLNVADVAFKLAAASLEKGVMPDPGNVRSEEFINAFDYRDPEPAPGAPLAFAWERARYPFAQNRDLLRFAVKTAAAGRQPGRPLNIVLLLDNSGSMERADRVAIIRQALRVLATKLEPQDLLSVVSFARTATLRVDGVAGNQAAQVAEEIGGLTPQGGTNLEEAMRLAYETARRHYLANGMNRVVLLTDGAANLGNVDPAALKEKVEANRKQGIALDCFGIGWEGYNDDLLETLSRNGDGRYGFINTPEEAATDFVGQLAGALNVAASDVKVQVEFNPKRVTSYRQVGYAKHQLTKEQFRDNTVNAAQIGAAESGNALYTVEVNPLGEGPLAMVRVRYRVPGTQDYHEHEWAVPFEGNALGLEQSSSGMRLAGAASAFAEWLAASPFAAEVTPDRLLSYLNGVPEAFGADQRPKKLEWMIRQAKSLSGK